MGSSKDSIFFFVITKDDMRKSYDFETNCLWDVALGLIWDYEATQK